MNWLKKLSNDIKDFKTYKITDIPKIFEENSKSIKDIYECRKFRIIKDANPSTDLHLFIPYQP